MENEYVLDELLKVKGHSRTIILFLWKFAAENPVCFTEHKENISKIRDCLTQIGLDYKLDDFPAEELETQLQYASHFLYKNCFYNTDVLSTDMGTATRPLKVWNDYIRKNKGNLNRYLEERGKSDKLFRLKQSFRDWVSENKNNPKLFEWMDLTNEQFKVTKRSPLRPEGPINYNSDSDNTDKDHSSDDSHLDLEQIPSSIQMFPHHATLPPITGTHLLPPVKTENAENRKRALEEPSDQYKSIPLPAVMMNNHAQKVAKIDQIPVSLPSMQTVVNNANQLLPGDRVRVDLGDGQLLIGEVYAVVGKIYYVDVNGMSIQTLRNRLSVV